MILPQDNYVKYVKQINEEINEILADAEEEHSVVDDTLVDADDAEKNPESKTVKITFSDIVSNASIAIYASNLEERLIAENVLKYIYDTVGEEKERELKELVYQKSAEAADQWRREGYKEDSVHPYLKQMGGVEIKENGFEHLPGLEHSENLETIEKNREQNEF